MADKTYQMLWDCSRCGTEKLLGLDHRFCPACGAPQDPERRYFPEESEKVAVEDHAFAGTDKACPACDTPNSAASAHCGACGAPMEGGKDVRTRDAQESDTAGQFEADSGTAARDEHRADKQAEEAERRGAPPPPPPPATEPEPKGGVGRGGVAAGLGLFGSGALVLVCAVLCCGFFLWSREADLTVTGHSWVRTIDVEAKKKVSKSDWKEKVPSKATQVSCSKKQKDTKKIKDGETCKTVRSDQGDGTFKETEKCTPKYREEPIYGQHCSYKILEWTTVRTEKASGSKVSDTPTWPKVSLKSGEREGDKDQDYTVKLEEADGTARSCTTPNEKLWKGFAVGKTYTGSVGVMSGAVRCDDLKPAG